MFNRLLAPAAIALLLATAGHPALADEVIRVADVPRDQYQQMHEMGDFWSVDSKTGEVVMYVSERQRAAIEALGYEVRLDEARMRSLEYARSIDAEAWERSGVGGIPGFACYRTVDETKTDLSAMAAQRPELARWESIGETWREANGETGGDELYALVLGNQNSPHEQPPFVLMAAQHARELTTAETATRFAEWLFDNYDTDPTARWLLDHREIHIIAQQNPDGRREVEEGQNMWRKNSNLNACPSGTTGVDLNRNSDYNFGKPESSGIACDQDYRGSEPHSEPETQAIQNHMHQVFEQHRPGSPDDLPTDPAPADAQGLFISLHSFSEFILFPWEGSGSGAENRAPNHDQLAWLGRRFGFFTGYEVGREVIWYQAGGTTTDYAYGEFGVAAYTYEIGTAFQESCDTFENELWPDLLESLIYAAKATARPYQAPSGPDVVDPLGVVNTQDDTLHLSGVLDDTRFDRGGASEGPSDDPVEDVVELRVSLDEPPEQAGSWFTIDPESEAPVTGFDAEIALEETITLPRLVFFQAVDSAGHVGVPEAAWLSEQIAAVSPGSLETTLTGGQSTVETVTISNIGSESLDWSAQADLPAAARDGHDPGLDETLNLSDFSLPGGGSASETVSAGIDSRGQAVGFSFEGTVANLGGSAWASDMAMTITAPDGESFTVGGYESSNPDWDFQGSGSGSAGTYSSTHIGSDIFGAEGALDEGDWAFNFQDTWEGGMDWSDVTVTLHKQEPPTCVDPAGVAWLSLDQSSGTLAPGEDEEIAVTFDAAGLDAGEYEALLCVTTSDPSAELIELGVSLQVISGDPQIFRDRFETDSAAD
ncbi:M14 family zinc carboxypeptidase [Wenzhouxiangella sp. EGI_FJ10409]|uniref:M14 family zinc carboxypeptidase n=1 Tax=Wenzhouxiangella sp. EGI_FJ10409 TaxID=3243767 RepID=UPI0035DD145C